MSRPLTLGLIQCLLFVTGCEATPFASGPPDPFVTEYRMEERLGFRFEGSTRNHWASRFTLKLINETTDTTWSGTYCLARYDVNGVVQDIGRWSFELSPGGMSSREFEVRFDGSLKSGGGVPGSGVYGHDHLAWRLDTTRGAVA